MRKLTFKYLIAFLTLSAFHAYGQQQPSQSRIPTQSGDDAPIIIGDTSAFPIEDYIQVTDATVKSCPSSNARYRYLYSKFFRHTEIPGGAPDQIGDDTGTHQVTVLFACSRDPITCMYKPDWGADLSGGNPDAIHIWDAGGFSTHFRLTWDNGNRITIEPAGHAKPSSVLTAHYGLDLDYPLRKIRSASGILYQRPDDTKDYRFVLHYCTPDAPCTLTYLRANNPCALGLPPKEAAAEAAKPPAEPPTKASGKPPKKSKPPAK